MGFGKGKGHHRETYFIGAFAPLVYEPCLNIKKIFQIYSPELDCKTVYSFLKFWFLVICQDHMYAFLKFYAKACGHWTVVNVDTLTDRWIDNMV